MAQPLYFTSDEEVMLLELAQREPDVDYTQYAQLFVWEYAPERAPVSCVIIWRRHNFCWPEPEPLFSSP